MNPSLDRKRVDGNLLPTMRAPVLDPAVKGLHHDVLDRLYILANMFCTIFKSSCIGKSSCTNLLKVYFALSIISK